jgi:uncharacterized membrane protein
MSTLAGVSSGRLAHQAAIAIGARILEEVCSTLDQAASFRALEREHDAGAQLAQDIERAIESYARALLAPEGGRP